MVQKLSPNRASNYDTGLHTVNEEGIRSDPEREADFGRAYQKLVQKFYKD